MELQKPFLYTQGISPLESLRSHSIPCENTGPVSSVEDPPSLRSRTYFIAHCRQRISIKAVISMETTFEIAPPAYRPAGVRHDKTFIIFFRRSSLRLAKKTSNESNEKFTSDAM